MNTSTLNGACKVLNSDGKTNYLNSSYELGALNSVQYVQNKVFYAETFQVQLHKFLPILGRAVLFTKGKKCWELSSTGFR